MWLAGQVLCKFDDHWDRWDHTPSSSHHTNQSQPFTNRSSLHQERPTTTTKNLAIQLGCGLKLLSVYTVVLLLLYSVYRYCETVSFFTCIGDCFTQSTMRLCCHCQQRNFWNKISVVFTNKRSKAGGYL